MGWLRELSPPTPSGGDYAEIACSSRSSHNRLRDCFGRDDRSGSRPYRYRHGRARLLELRLKLLDLLVLRERGVAPFAHSGELPDPLRVGVKLAVERDGIGAKTADDRGVHRVRHADLAEQEWAAIGLQAFAPDVENPVDVGLRL